MAKYLSTVYKLYTQFQMLDLSLYRDGWLTSIRIHRRYAWREWSIKEIDAIPTETLADAVPNSARQTV